MICAISSRLSGCIMSISRSVMYSLSPITSIMICWLLGEVAYALKTSGSIIFQLWALRHSKKAVAIWLSDRFLRTADIFIILPRPPYPRSVFRNMEPPIPAFSDMSTSLDSVVPPGNGPQDFLLGGFLTF